MNMLAIQPGPPATCPVVFMPKVSEEPCYAHVPAGQTLEQMLGGQAAYSLRVTVGGIEVPRSLWPHVRPKAGTRVNVEFWPQGGGGARKWILTIVAIVATIFSYGAASGAAWAAVGGLSATTVAIGGALIAGLALSMIPPPTAKLSAGGDPLDQLKSLTGTQNNASPYGAIPLVIGSCRFYPTHAAMPYTEISGSDQYLRMLLDLGYGDLDISDIQIGNTPIDEYQDVEYEISTAPTLFTQDIYELQVGTALKASGDSDVRTTQQASTEISLDIVFPSGLFGRDKKGNSTIGYTSFTVEYRAVGASTWLNVTAAAGLSLVGGLTNNAPLLKIQSSRAKAMRLGVRWAVASGQYEVRVTRGATTFPNALDGATQGDAAWSVLRSISPQNPSTTGTLKLAVRIRATDQLSGVVSTLSVRAAQRVRRWDESTQTWLDPVASTNPAWIYLWLMTECPGKVRHVSDEQMDLTTLSSWAADCDANGYTYGGVADSVRVASDVFKDVLACGLASPGIRNGKHTIVRDLPQTVPMQTYTPINQTSLRWSRVFADPPHALRVSFTNPEAENQQDELLVYWDGYNASNTTHIEKLDLRNVNNPEAAWRIARYHLAVMWLRPNTYTVEVDFEYLINERGDLVEVASPLIGWAVSYGRIRGIGGTTLTLSEPFHVESGKSYAIRVRFGDAYSDVRNVTIAAGDIIDGATRVVTLASSLAGVAVDQLYVVGEVNKLTLPLILTAIEPGGSMLERTARLTLVDSDPGVWEAAQGTPPPFVSAINGKPWCSPPDPPVVQIRLGDSAPDDAGVIHAQAGVSGAPKPGIHRMPLFGGGCPSIDALVRRVRPDGSIEEVRAGDVAVGDVLQTADPLTLAPMTAEVSYSQPELQPCVEIRTASGAVLPCSSSAPIPTAEGRLVRAPNLYGHTVPVWAAEGVRWERVVHLRGIGRAWVQHISIDDGCFWANGVLHHNKAPRKTLE